MTYLIVLGIVALLMAAETVRLLVRSGDMPRRIPTSHGIDAQLRPPASPA